MARQTYSLAYDHPAFMGRIHAALCYYLLPTDLNVDAKSIKSSFEVESNSVIDDERVTLRKVRGKRQPSPELGRKFIRRRCSIVVYRIYSHIRGLHIGLRMCCRYMIDASLTAIKRSALLSSARQISL